MMDKIDEILKCPKCKKQIKEPKMLPVCQHSFCATCVWDLVQDGSVKCSVCEIKLPRNSVIPKNLLLGKILQLFYSQPQNEPGHPYLQHRIQDIAFSYESKAGDCASKDELDLDHGAKKGRPDDSYDLESISKE